MSLILLVMKDPRVFLLPETPLRGDLRYHVQNIGYSCTDLGQVLTVSIAYLHEDPAKAPSGDPAHGRLRYGDLPMGGRG